MLHRILLLALLGLAIAACSSVRISKHPRFGAPSLTPTDSAHVEILHRPPMRPFVRLGRIRATPRGGADEQQIETALRQAAASMGADAIVMTRDSDAATGRVEATAIAYRAP